MGRPVKTHIHRIIQSIRQERSMLAVLAVGVVFFLAWPFLNQAFFSTNRWWAVRATKPIQAAMARDVASALAQTKMLAKDQRIRSLIEQADTVKLLEALSDAQAKSGLFTLIAVSRDGVALARIPTVTSRGDYVLQTTPWGRAAAEGRSVSNIGVGWNFPLVITAAAPVLAGDKFAGAVFGGFWMDDDYARRVVQQSPQPGLELVFYSRQDGVIGTTFHDRTKSIVTSHFSLGTDWIQSGQTDEPVSVNGQTYLVHNVVFDGYDGQPGGVLVFVPARSTWLLLAWSLLTTGLFVLIAWGIHRYLIRTHQTVRSWPVGATGFVALIILVGTFGLNKLDLIRRTIRLQPPTFTIFNSVLQLVPDQNIIQRNIEQRVQVVLLSGGEAINAVQAVIAYDPSVAEAKEIVTTRSFCQPDLFVEKIIDPAKGEIRIACGLPSPGFNGLRGIVAEVIFQPVRTGQLDLQLTDETQVLANDGLGTNVLRAVTNASYQVTDQAEAARLTIYSPTHPNPARWYQRREIEFTWPKIPDTLYAVAFDQMPDTRPDGTRIATGHATAEQVNRDGVYYFHVAPIRNGTHGPASHLTVRIDATPPAKPDIRASTTVLKPGELLRLRFASTDTMSGLQKNYYVRIDQQVRLPTLPTMFLAFDRVGSHTVTVRVFDQANNYRDAALAIKVKR